MQKFFRLEVELEDRLEIEKREDTTRDKGQFTVGGAHKSNSRLLQHLNTRISIGTEVKTDHLPRIQYFFMTDRNFFFKKDGQFVYVDWLPQKDADSSKLTSKNLKLFI